VASISCIKQVILSGYLMIKVSKLTLSNNADFTDAEQDAVITVINMITAGLLYSLYRCFDSCLNMFYVVYLCVNNLRGICN